MGKGGGGSQHTPVEQDDNLKTSQIISIIDIWGEGTILGTVNGLKDVFLNDTAVMSESGEINIPGITYLWNNGTEDQDYLSGFDGSANIIPVGVTVKKDSPVVRTVTNSLVDRLSIILGTPALYEVSDNGDTNRTNLSLSVQVFEGGSWVEKGRLDWIDKKSRGEALAQVFIDDLPPTPFNIRVVRETDDSTSQKLANDSFWRSYTEIVDEKFRWPLTAYAGIKIDSKSFGGQVPRRNYRVKGLVVQIPSNYDPVNRTYAGFWDGEFKAAWTDNPAWIAYDVVTTKRYGLGRRVPAELFDKYFMYKVSMFCDQMVDDGFGGLEPRMTCNVNLTERRPARDVINDFYSIFRGMPVWDGMTYSGYIDTPDDPVYTYNRSNIKGKFTYSSSQRKDRHTALEVTFIDKKNNFKKETIYVQDDDLVNRYGFNLKKVDAFGCSTRGQAKRAGLYILETEKLERNIVSFSVGASGLFHLPGNIIEIADSSYYGASIGGRVLSFSQDKKTITLDREIEIPTGAVATFGYVSNERKVKKIEIESYFDKTIVLKSPADDIKEYSAWSLGINNSTTRLFRCMGITRTDSGEFGINAVEHIPEKTAIIDNGVIFDPPANSLYPDTIPAPTNILLEPSPDLLAGQYRAHWDTPRTARIINFQVKLMLLGAVVSSQIVDRPEVYYSELSIGNYVIQVRGIDQKGKMGAVAEAAFSIALPETPIDISWTSGNLTATLKPVTKPIRTIGEGYKWYFGNTEAEVIAQTNYLGEAFILNKVDLRPQTTYWFGCRAFNPIGISPGIRTVQIQTKFDSTDLEGLINQALPNTDYIKEINKDIDGLSDLATMRVVDKNGTNPRITGIYMNAGDAESGVASIIDFVADALAISSPDNLERWVYFDSVNRQLVIVGDIRARAGTLDNVTINESCVIKGKLSVANIEGYSMEGQSYEFTINTTGTRKTINYAGNPQIPVRLFGQVWARQYKNQKTRVRVNGTLIDQLEVSVIVNDNGTVTTRAYVWLYTFVKDLAVNQAAEIVIDGGAIDQGNSESTSYRAQFWIAPQSNGFSSD
ncbi:putative tail tip protein [Serratia phage vB_SmaS_PhooPhighters]|uniref:Putative tail tip protein n=1 Tax=Serratia phage vB_SmaS_Rovert TaxID=2777363 RepID=A0A7T3N9U5_9CAUD|nr:putative tail tip protein [Serratia phage vB_SmaS_Rovert]QPX74990.1 putative tail tip protein [Serratia phage vB_SmaS_Rovert]UGO51963.1 putative tail tip protein [Serratia phage vB_SmaS_PhooPhighters]